MGEAHCFVLGEAHCFALGEAHCFVLGEAHYFVILYVCDVSCSPHVGYRDNSLSECESGEWHVDVCIPPACTVKYPGYQQCTQARVEGCKVKSRVLCVRKTGKKYIKEHIRIGEVTNIRQKHPGGSPDPVQSPFPKLISLAFFPTYPR